MYATVNDFRDIVPLRTMQRWLRRGLLPGIKYQGRWSFYPHDAFEYITSVTIYRACVTRKSVYVLAIKKRGSVPMGWIIFEAVPPTRAFRDLVYRLDSGSGKVVSMSPLVTALVSDQLLTHNDPVRYIAAFPTLAAAEAAGELAWRKFVYGDIGWRFWLY